MKFPFLEDNEMIGASRSPYVCEKNGQTDITEKGAHLLVYPKMPMKDSIVEENMPLITLLTFFDHFVVIFSSLPFLLLFRGF
mmetsp:Transcript_27658/g.50224  ORF Transcript_27658/g.50224 Transcript_27658/m.50224 type:complete len:82 (-) Transcript_27658:3257-3502(-)